MKQSLACCIIALINLAATSSGLTASEPALRFSTEVSSPGEIQPPGAVLDTVLRETEEYEKVELDQCIAEKNLKRGNYAALFRATPIRNAVGRVLWFVRPALEPYCFTFYGAHNFRYFLIEERRVEAGSRYRIVFQNRGDMFVVHRQLSHGLNDIEATGCIVSGCRSARMSYDGRTYRAVRCTRTVFRGNRPEITRARHCGSDEGSDLQASGFTDR